jgi:SAM-dependent methyltransferase
MIKNQKLVQFMNNGYTHIEGFCHDSAFYILDHLDETNTNKNKKIMEIGIHHGQFFIGINQLTNDTAYAVDVFDDQHLNIDHSGRANLLQFQQNLINYDHNNAGENVKIIAGDSTDYNTFKDVDRCFYISVDGGHTAEHVVNDLTVASNLLCNNGIVILDDYFNHWWPTVTEGLVKYLGTTPTLVPFCTSPNKMWLCKISYKDFYLDHLEKIAQFGKTKTCFFSHTILDLW